eukprot:CAMPEP_0197590438 /NCGR_PEP_ID=MMETSP1326-20131121/11029_1 /TAXON_ID=1155430 /ORGANISM="Genus nov. species nov., Strain RCC2288" /LENGTH=133 /DNA_ID=CAMNT_0043155467 /DNA_START=73 /DNA_END=474 /DNA_ORIENTATION=+
MAFCISASSSTFVGRKVAAKPAGIRRAARAATVQPKAKYGDESVYFDLTDIEASTGSWDVYGSESKARYPGQQAEFFEMAAQGLGRREAMYSFLALAGSASLLIAGGQGSKMAKLPISMGPQQTPALGPRDKL